MKSMSQTTDFIKIQPQKPGPLKIEPKNLSPDQKSTPKKWPFPDGPYNGSYPRGMFGSIFLETI